MALALAVQVSLATVMATAMAVARAVAVYVAATTVTPHVERRWRRRLVRGGVATAQPSLSPRLVRGTATPQFMLCGATPQPLPEFIDGATQAWPRVRAAASGIIDSIGHAAAVEYAHNSCQAVGCTTSRMAA